MSVISYYRLLSWTGVSGALIFIAWITFGPYGFWAAPAVICIMLVLMLAALRLGHRHLVDYWEVIEKPVQAPRIAIVIFTIVGFNLIGGAALQLTNNLSYMSESLLALIAWVLIPLAFVGCGFVSWPQRRTFTPRRDLLIVGIISILIAAAIGLLKVFPGENAMPSLGVMAIQVPKVLVLATMEELVFRFLLLTALIQASQSRTYALILSSVLFGLIHIIIAFAPPIVAMDWSALPALAAAYFPGLVWQLGVGFLLGALWMRTGSIALIAITHALLNVNMVLG